MINIFLRKKPVVKRRGFFQIQATSSSDDLPSIPSIDLELEENPNKSEDEEDWDESELLPVYSKTDRKQNLKWNPFYSEDKSESNLIIPKITSVFSYVTSEAKSDITAITDHKQNLRLNPYYRKRKRILKPKRDFGTQEPKRQYEPYIWIIATELK